MVLKIVGSVLTIASCATLGFYFSNELVTRLKQLNELKKYITILRGDIRYGATPLPEAIRGIASRNPGVFETFFHKVADRLFDREGGTLRDIWEESVEAELKETCMTKEDKDGLIRLGENLGYLDREMQINTIDLYLSQLEEVIKEQTIVVKERTRLYNTLGVMGGIFITIVMI